MAMSLRPRGGAARRGRSGIRPVYEDFKPTYEWKHEEGASILLYHLPGFSKEQIRIIAESKGVLRIRGERLITSNKWSRFEEEVVVPEDCNMSEIRAKFEGGVLRIIMPKKMITTNKKQPIEEQSNATYEGPPKPSVTKPNVPPKPQLHDELQEEVFSKPTLPQPPIAPKPQFGSTGISLPPPTPWKDRESEAQPQPIRQQEAATTPMKLPPIDHISTKISQDNIYDGNKAKYAKDRKVHDDPTNIGGSKEGESVAMPTSLAKENDIKEQHDDALDEIQAKHDMYADALDQDKGSNYDLSKMNRFDKAMKSRLSKRSFNEDKQLLVNMGAAILVIFALGTSISYSFGSSD
ncbi:Inactive protein RESTRICTED TEV MOVEMENT 2 [Bienertia sinuspersici]